MERFSSSQDEEMSIPMPMPLNSTYAQNNNPMNQQQQTPSSNGSPTLTDHDQLVPYKKTTTTTTTTRYKECLKNHAAAMGGNATDGCGEFLPGEEDGLTCSACSCHRNFHRKETVDNDGHGELPHNLIMSPRIINAAKIFVGHSLRPHHQMIMPYNNVNAAGEGRKKKRFRTKFTQEQKEKMLGFAEKVGWKMQKQEEGVVQQFCQEIGIKRRVLKVWMHNNKNHHQYRRDQSNPNHDESQQD